MEALALALGLLGVALLGAWHLAGLLLLKRLKPSGEGQGYLAVLTTFWGLLALHVSEILWCALMIAGLLMLDGAGTVAGGIGSDTAGVLYLAGITFTSLGFTGQTVQGPVSLLLMLLSLGGFMLITWSATFVYTLWEERFR